MPLCAATLILKALAIAPYSNQCAVFRARAIWTQYLPAIGRRAVHALIPWQETRTLHRIIVDYQLKWQWSSNDNSRYYEECQDGRNINDIHT
jgi:hypothetical protein